jgi:hypothetical protein
MTEDKWLREARWAGRSDEENRMLGEVRPAFVLAVG